MSTDTTRLREELAGLERISTGPTHRALLLRDWAKSRAEQLAALVSSVETGDDAIEALGDAITRSEHPRWGGGDVVGFYQADPQEVLARLGGNGYRLVRWEEARMPEELSDGN